MPEIRTGPNRLDRPFSRRRSLSVDPEVFGRFSEQIARLIGTGKFLMWQTILVVLWVAINLTAVTLRWDPYPFILLNLAFSTQAAYAAPLILLAQNRQEARDRIGIDQDRERAAQSRADMDFLAREIASVRMSVGELATRDYLRSQLPTELRAILTELEDDEV